MLRRAFAKNSPTMAKNIAAYTSPNASFALFDFVKFVGLVEFRIRVLRELWGGLGLGLWREIPLL